MKNLKKYCFVVLLFLISNKKIIALEQVNFNSSNNVVSYIKISNNIENSKTTIFPFVHIVDDNSVLEKVSTIYSKNPTINKVLELSVSKIGIPYSQTYRESGSYYDCSSFVRKMYQEVTGVYIGLNTYEIAEKLRNYEISFNDLEVGDLLWQQGHIAMYFGDELIIHSSGSINGVGVESMYRKGLNFTKAFRVIDYIEDN